MTLVDIQTTGDSVNFWVNCHTDEEKMKEAEEQGRQIQLDETTTKRLLDNQNYIDFLKGLWAIQHPHDRLTILHKFTRQGEHTLLLYEYALTVAYGAPDEQVDDYINKYVLPYSHLAEIRIVQDIACFKDRSVDRVTDVLNLCFQTSLKAILQEKGVVYEDKLGDSEQVVKKVQALANKMIGPASNPSSPKWLSQHISSATTAEQGIDEVGNPTLLHDEATWPTNRAGVFRLSLEKFPEYVRQQKQLDIHQYRQLAERGNAAAQYNLGVCYALGKGVEADAQQAVHWYRKAAKQGDAIAQATLGSCYHKGVGVELDAKQAVHWFKLAAEQGHAVARYNLGACYDKGKGVEANARQAVHWYKKAAEQGIAAAQHNLGASYDMGKGVKADAHQAAHWYRKAAKQGIAAAQFNLGLCYHEGKGVKADAQQAAHWSRKAADQGYAEAQAYLGSCYFNGSGVGVDPQQAVHWYRKAAEQGHDGAQHNLGVCYEKGNGVGEDAKKAVLWFRKAAEQGFAQAQHNLGVCYALGKGVEVDSQQAVQWLRKSAEQGFAEAQAKLAGIDELGGV